MVRLSGYVLLDYIVQIGICRDINYETKAKCPCEVCTKIQKDGYLYYADNLKPEVRCLCKICRDLRTENDPIAQNL